MQMSKNLASNNYQVIALLNCQRPMTREEVIQMNTQIRNTGSFANNFWVQMAALVVVVAIVIAFAAKYLW